MAGWIDLKLANEENLTSGADGYTSQYTGTKLVNFGAPGGNSTILLVGAFVALFILYKKGKI